uniref:Uncharacterized protein n=1 Tax=Photinus pyralis TaxID=7054 RepID=A0A1Y1NJ17_PHOPY
MISPEIWHFKAPNSLVKVEKGNISKGNCLNIVQKLPYNHLVSVVLPDTLRVPQNLFDLLKADCEYYKVSNIGLEELVNINFINSFVGKGTLVSLSINRRIDCEDCACVTPNGLLLLSLTKESYETLGLEGRASRYTVKQRYNNAPTSCRTDATISEPTGCGNASGQSGSSYFSRRTDVLGATKGGGVP